MKKLTKKLTKEEQELAAAKAKIERKYSRIAKRRLNEINQKLFPDVDLLGMSKHEFEQLMTTSKVVTKQQSDNKFTPLTPVEDDNKAF